MRRRFIGNLAVASLIAVTPACQPKVTQVPKLSETSSGYRASSDQWRRFLECWNKEYLERTASKETLFVPGPSMPAHLQLPRSYRDFMTAVEGRGFRTPSGAENNEVDLYPITQIGLFSTVDPSGVKNWTSAGTLEASDETYYRYDPIENHSYGKRHQDVIHIRARHIATSTLVGADWTNAHYFLLNPAEKTMDGEWEAWILNHTFPGAMRFRSFADLMSQLYYWWKFKPKGAEWFDPQRLNGTCAAEIKTWE